MPSSYYDNDHSGLILKKRSEVRPDEIIVERVPKYDQQMVPRGYYNDRGPRASSLDGQRGAMTRYRDPRDRDYPSDSEDDYPPPRRRNTGGGGGGGGRDGGRSRTKGGAQNNKSKSSRSSSVSSSDLGSSSGDERNCKKMKRKKYVTYGLASVATIHAAASIHGAIEGRAKRKEEVAEGTMSPEEQQKRNQQGLWKEAGAVGLSALGIWQAFKEGKESWELRGEHAHLEEEAKERHRKRQERQRRMKEQGGSERSRSTAGRDYRD